MNLVRGFNARSFVGRILTPAISPGRGRMVRRLLENRMTQLDRELSFL